MGALCTQNSDGICVFIKFTLFLYGKAGVFSPKENTPYFTSIKLVCIIMIAYFPKKARTLEVYCERIFICAMAWCHKCETCDKGT